MSNIIKDNIKLRNQFIDIYEKISNDNLTILDKLTILNKFKGHVKKELVNPDFIQSYFDTLLYVPNYIQSNPQLLIDEQDTVKSLLLTSHSALSYLVKRVSYQSPNSINNTLVNTLLSYFIKIQDIINNNNISQHNLGKKFWLLSNKAIEILYLTVPLFVEDSLLKFFNMINDSDENITENLNNNHLKYLLLIIDDLTRINLQSSNNNNSNSTIFLEIFLPHVITLLNNNMILKLINDNNTNMILIMELVNDILTKYFNENVFNEFKSKLDHQEIVKYFIKPISLTNRQDQESNNDNKSNIESNHVNTTNINNTSMMLFDLESEYNILLNDYKAPQLTNLINQNHLKFKSKNNDIASLSHEINNLLTPFYERKETESNWKARQANIITMRENFIINEQLIKDNKDELVLALRDMNFIDNIARAILSLRTSLSLNSCQLLKELLELLCDSMPITLLDQIFTLLKQLLSSTKKISSQMASHCLMIMFFSINEFHNKLFQNTFILMNEKSIIPRNASAILLRVFIIKFGKKIKLDSNLLYVEEWLKKGLADAQITVRDSMKLTFWYFYKAYPEQAKILLHNSFSSQLKKSLESSIPLHLSIDYAKQSLTGSNNSSSSNSRRSSLLSAHFQSNVNKRKFPSYAQPTQSSSILQKINSANHSNNNSPGLRSTSDNISHSNEPGTKKFKSGNNRVESNPLMKRKVSAPVRHISNNTLLDIENTSQFDITDEINSPHSNSLIKKYLENPSPSNQVGSPAVNTYPPTVKKHIINPEDESNKIISSFESQSNMKNSTDQKYKYSIQLLQNFLLRQSDRTLIERTISTIMPQIREILLRTPAELKNLLPIPIFVQSMPLKFTIELYSICNLNVEDIIKKLDFKDSSKFVDDISTLFHDLTSEYTEKDISFYYMKYREKIFNFSMILLADLLEDDRKFQLADSDFKLLLHQVMNIYGNEFDSRLYFNLMFQLYCRRKILFLENLVTLNLVSKKLKISNELQQRDPSFELPSSKKLQELKKKEKAETDSTEDVLTITDHDDDTNVKRYMEMTMVNPFKQNNSLDETLLNNRVQETMVKMENNENYTASHTADNTENKLSQMTKVISVYQTADSIRSNDTNVLSNLQEEEEGKDSKRSDIDLSDIFTKKKQINDTNMIMKRDKETQRRGSGNIDLKNEDDFQAQQEHTVKFSTDPPKVINDEFIVSVKENEDEAKGELDDVNLANVVRSPESSTRPVLKSTDAEIQPRIKTEESLQVPLKSESDANFSLINFLSPDSFGAFELNTILADEYNQPPELDSKNEFQFKHLLNAVHRIQNGTFTMKHLIYLIEPFINLTSESTSLVKWLRTDGGFTTLQEICLMLLSSTDETILIPTNMTSKALILLQCLLISNDWLTDIEPLSSNFITEVWDQLILLIDKLSDYNNEIYILLVETRQMLIRFKHFNSKDVTGILNKLLFIIYEYEKKDAIKEGNSSSTIDTSNRKKGMVGSFLLGTLSDLLKDFISHIEQPGTVIKKNQFSEIIQSLGSFTELELTEWRYGSCNVLSSVYYILSKVQNTPQHELDNKFSILNRFSYRLIKSMASSLGNMA